MEHAFHHKVLAQDMPKSTFDSDMHLTPAAWLESIYISRPHTWQVAIFVISFLQILQTSTDDSLSSHYLQRHPPADKDESTPSLERCAGLVESVQGSSVRLLPKKRSKHVPSIHFVIMQNTDADK